MEEYRRLNPISKKSMRIGYLIFTAIVAIAAIGSIAGLHWDSEFVYPAVFFGAITIIMVIVTAFFPGIYFNHYQYFISDDRVDVRKGIFFLKHTLVPIERIHQVEVVEGPVNRMFGLADVHITTAGGTASIDYLEKEEADRIADELNMIVGNIVRSQNE
ncbi:MAG: PH domain-containing protein [archaeon]|nr:PH domain-containing protein [archaeon]